MFVRLTRVMPKSDLTVPVCIRVDTIVSFTPYARRDRETSQWNMDGSTIVHTYVPSGDQSWPGTDSWRVTESVDEIAQMLAPREQVWPSV